jgi:endonuclease YncB( thermonuclease family)
MDGCASRLGGRAWVVPVSVRWQTRRIGGFGRLAVGELSPTSKGPFMPVPGGLLLGGAVAGITALSVAGVVGIVTTDAAVPSRTVERVIDGDTVQMANGDRVRLIGIDTPEAGDCGAQEATDRLAALVLGEYVQLVNPASVQDTDRYDRLLRYIDLGDTDAGQTLLGAGLAVARYDSLDGYDPHPRQDAYRSLDQATETMCERDERLAEERRIAEEKRLAEEKAAEEAAAAAAEAERLAAEKAETERLAKEQAEAERRAEEERRQQEAEAAAEAERQRQAEADAAAQRERERQQQEQSQPSQPAPPSSGFVPPPGWTTDALTPGYTGCRQGYPGGKINGIYVWKPIPC